MTQKTITCKYLRAVVLNCTLKQLQIYDSFREAFKDLAGHYDLALKIAPLFVVFRI